MKRIEPSMTSRWQEPFEPAILVEEAGKRRIDDHCVSTQPSCHRRCDSDQQHDTDRDDLTHFPAPRQNGGSPKPAKPHHGCPKAGAGKLELECFTDTCYRQLGHISSVLAASFNVAFETCPKRGVEPHDHDRGSLTPLSSASGRRTIWVGEGHKPSRPTFFRQSPPHSCR